MYPIAPTDRYHHIDSPQRDVLATENIALPDLALVHGEAQARGDNQGRFAYGGARNVAA